MKNHNSSQKFSVVGLFFYLNFTPKVKFFIVFFTCDVENKNIIGVKNMELKDEIKKLREKVEECVKKDFIEHYQNIDYRICNEYIKTRRTTLGVFKEIENKIVIEDHCGNTSDLLANDEIVNWRVFPKARTHLNQLHLIDNKFINIFGFEI